MEKYALMKMARCRKNLPDHVFLHEDCCRQKKYTGNGKKNILLYGGDLDQNGITSALYAMLHELDLTKYNYFLVFPSDFCQRSS